MVVLADSLALVGGHARRVNTDTPLRRRLAQQQADDRVPEERQVGEQGGDSDMTVQAGTDVGEREGASS